MPQQQILFPQDRLYKYLFLPHPGTFPHHMAHSWFCRLLLSPEVEDCYFCRSLLMCLDTKTYCTVSLDTTTKDILLCNFHNTNSKLIVYLFALGADFSSGSRHIPGRTSFAGVFSFFILILSRITVDTFIVRRVFLLPLR